MPRARTVLLGDRARQGDQHLGQIGGGHPVAAQAGVDLESRDGGGPRCGGPRRSASLSCSAGTTPRSARRRPAPPRSPCPVRAARPARGRGDAVVAQGQRLGDGGHPPFGGAGGQRGTRDRGGAVAVPVGLDHHHDRRGARVFAQHRARCARSRRDPPRPWGRAGRVSSVGCIASTLSCRCRRPVRDESCGQCAKGCTESKWPPGFSWSRCSRAVMVSSPQRPGQIGGETPPGPPPAAR